MVEMSDESKELIKDAAKRLTGFKKRQYQASIALKYFDGSARKTERVMGWGRDTLEKGLGEARTGIRCLDNFKERGRKKAEDALPGLEADVRAIAERKDSPPPRKSGWKQAIF